MNIEHATSMFIAQGKGGPFGLWEIVKVVKEELGAQETYEIWEQSMHIVHALLQSGMRAGDSPYKNRGDFIAWPEDNLEAIVARIKNEWVNSARVPNIPDSPWFGSGM